MKARATGRRTSGRHDQTVDEAHAVHRAAHRSNRNGRPCRDIGPCHCFEYSDHHRLHHVRDR